MLAPFESVHSAQAQDSSPEADGATQSARAFFREGTERARRGDWSQALLAFERSNALRPHFITTYNISYCERALGQITRARKMFGLALAGDPKEGGPGLPVELVSAARIYLSELQRRVAHAIVRLSPEDSSIQIDGRPLERSSSSGPRPVVWAGTRDLGPGEPAPPSPFDVELDPGTHVIVLSKAGHADLLVTRTFEAGSETPLTLTLPAESDVPGRGPIGGPGSGVPAPLGGERAVENRRPPSPGPFFVALGAAVGGLMTGVVAGGIALMQKAKMTGACSPSHVCTTNTATTYLARANTAADVSTTGFIVGAVGAGSAAAVWWLSTRSAGTSVSVAPWIAPLSVGLSGRF